MNYDDRELIECIAAAAPVGRQVNEALKNISRSIEAITRAPEHKNAIEINKALARMMNNDDAETEN